MEHTSNYWKPIALTLKNAGFYVSVVNAMLIHDFSDNSIRKLKTDRADSLKIANYALTFWNQLPPYPPDAEHKGFGHGPTSILNLIFRNQIPDQHLVQLRPYSVHRGGVIRPPAKQSGIEQVFSKTTKQQELGVAVHAPAKSDF